MIIEVKNVGRVNRGAELMFLAAREQVLASSLPSPAFALRPESWPFQERAAWGAYTKLGHVRFRIDWSRFGDLLPRAWKDSFGLVVDRDLDAVLDASGFAYGDRWPLGGLAHSVRQARAMKRAGKAYILLPQAFGPFTDPRKRALMGELVAASALVYARDEVSYAHLTEIVGEAPNLRLCPDFTNLLHPAPKTLEGRVALVIPNVKMVPGGVGAVAGSPYAATINAAVSRLSEDHDQVILVNHAGKEDAALCRYFQAQDASGKASVLDGLSGLEIKACIGGARTVVCSRYHGCVSSLSQGVPAIATSWSHKYETLYEEYGVPELIVGPSDDVAAKIGWLSANEEAARRALTTHQAAVQRKVEGMWAEVIGAMAPR